MTTAVPSTAGLDVYPQRARRRPYPPTTRQIPGISDLHARAVEGDADATDEIVRSLLPALRARLRRAFPMDSVDWITHAIDDALLEYWQDPSRYDPTRGRSLENYLYFNARRNVLNVLDSARRRLTREASAVAPEFWQDLAASTPGEPSSQLERLRRLIAAVRSGLTPEEQIVHDLQMADEHDTAVYARALHLDHLPWPEQVRQVRLRTNAVSHRVRRALRRLRDQLAHG